MSFSSTRRRSLRRAPLAVGLVTTLVAALAVVLVQAPAQAAPFASDTYSVGKRVWLPGIQRCANIRMKGTITASHFGARGARYQVYKPRIAKPKITVTPLNSCGMHATRARVGRMKIQQSFYDTGCKVVPSFGVGASVGATGPSMNIGATFTPVCGKLRSLTRKTPHPGGMKSRTQFNSNTDYGWKKRGNTVRIGSRSTVCLRASANVLFGRNGNTDNTGQVDLGKVCVSKN